MRASRMRVVAVAALSLSAVLWSGSLFKGPVAEPVPPAASTTRLQISPPDVALAHLGEDLSPSELPHPPELPIPPIQTAR
jgi:hypothetical protein